MASAMLKLLEEYFFGMSSDSPVFKVHVFFCCCCCFCFCFLVFVLFLFCFCFCLFVLFCFVLFCFLFFCFALFCFVLFCFVFFFLSKWILVVDSPAQILLTLLLSIYYSSRCKLEVYTIIYTKD